MDGWHFRLTSSTPAVAVAVARVGGKTMFCCDNIATSRSLFSALATVQYEHAGTARQKGSVIYNGNLPPRGKAPVGSVTEQVLI